MRVALLNGCAQTVLDTRINEATIRLLTRHGVEVVVPAGGLAARWRIISAKPGVPRLRRAQHRGLVARDRSGRLDAVVINTRAAA